MRRKVARFLLVALILVVLQPPFRVEAAGINLMEPENDDFSAGNVTGWNGPLGCTGTNATATAQAGNDGRYEARILENSSGDLTTSGTCQWYEEFAMGAFVGPHMVAFRAWSNASSVGITWDGWESAGCFSAVVKDLPTTNFGWVVFMSDPADVCASKNLVRYRFYAFDVEDQAGAQDEWRFDDLRICPRSCFPTIQPVTTAEGGVLREALHVA